MSKALKVSVPLANPRAEAIVETFERAGVPLSLNLVRHGLTCMWEARLGDRSFSALPLDAVSENYGGPQILGLAARTPDAAIINLYDDFCAALKEGSLVGVHRYGKNVRQETIDNITFVGGTAEQPEIVARVNYCGGRQTHPFIAVKSL